MIGRHTVYWQETEAVTPRPRLDGDLDADVCLIGGGYTSLWTAHFLKKAEPDLRICILEADYVGAGGSGHNDGFVTPTIGHGLGTVVRQFGIEAAKPAYTALGRSIMELRRFVRKHDIDAELDTSGFYLVATSTAQRRRLEHDVEISRQFGDGMSLELTEGAEVRRSVPSAAIVAGIPGGGALINPFKLCRGLARVVEGQGVEIYERSRVVDVREGGDGGRQRVLTGGGSVSADTVVYGTNAYQTAFDEHRRALLPVWSYALVSEPLDDAQLDRLGWTERVGFVEAKNFIVFGRLTADNRVLIGGGPAPYHFGGSMDLRHVRNDRVEARLRAEAVRFFPSLEAVSWEYSYGGAIAMTRDFVPQVGRTGPNTFFAHGYCGNGISCTHLVGKVLRDLILDRESTYRSLFFVRSDAPRVPPEPFASAGAWALSTALRAQDRVPRAIPVHLV